LFDFGLAKELKKKDERLDGLYELTGNTGSRRYMAPEVGLDECYDKSVDVYSFGILLWEMCSAETPFHGYNSAKHMELVVMGGERPSMDASHTAAWPMNLQWLMNRCWSATPADRPTFTAIKRILLEVLECKESAIASPPASPGMGGSIPSLKPLPAKGRSKTWGFMKR
jgi:serine/threonine protein kinase